MELQQALALAAGPDLDAAVNEALGEAELCEGGAGAVDRAFGACTWCGYRGEPRPHNAPAPKYSTDWRQVGNLLARRDLELEISTWSDGLFVAVKNRWAGVEVRGKRSDLPVLIARAALAVKISLSPKKGSL